MPEIIEKLIKNTAESGSGHKFELNAKRNIKHIVLHHIEAPKGIDEAIDYFNQHGVSAHYVIAQKGEIYNIVAENNIAFHAGTSYWRGETSLNKTSIGIEILSDDPFRVGFTKLAMSSLIFLLQQLIVKYKIDLHNISGHSDIAYFNDENGFLNRKQDPSHLFNWKILAQNNLAICPEIDIADYNDKKLFKLMDSSVKITTIKKQLNDFGYRVVNFNEQFDLEMQMLATVFNRRFNPDKFFDNDAAKIWYVSSQKILDLITN